jgi:hypothetical protein
VHRVPTVRFLLLFVRAPLSSNSQNSCEQTTGSAWPFLIACRLCVGNLTRALSPQFCLSFVTRQEDIHERVKRASVPRRC